MSALRQDLQANQHRFPLLAAVLLLLRTNEASALEILSIKLSTDNATEKRWLTETVSPTLGSSEVMGRSAIWLRGSSSRSHPKKPYRLEFQDENGNDLKKELAEMPADSDWILYPAYRDKSLIRDVLGYDLWREMGYYAPRYRFIELFIVTNEASLKSNALSLESAAQIPKYRNTEPPKKVETAQAPKPRPPPKINIRIPQPPLKRAQNIRRAFNVRLDQLMPEILTEDAHEEKPKAPWHEGMPEIDSVWPGISKQGIKWENYQGVYIVMEKIKRGKDRLNIKKLKPEHGGEPAITGGYIFKRDRLNRGEQGFTSNNGMVFAYEEPKESEITPAQRAYLTNFVNEFEQVLFSDRFTDPEDGYRKYIDVDSFIDYHWMVEISRNVDGYSYSVFFHKDRNGKLKAGPIWDWDLSFGNCKPQQGTRTNGWQFEAVAGMGYNWYKRLFEDPDFLQRYIDRWAELRANILATSNIHARIDHLAAELGSAAVDRNFKRWPTLGKQLFPTFFIGQTYQEEIDWLKSWIAKRLAWIDTQDFPGPVVHRRDAETQSTNALLVAQNSKCTEVTMAWLVGQVFYTMDGSDPRLSGGAVSARAVEYKQPVMVAPGAQLCARVRSEHGLWSAPRVVKISDQ